MKIGSRIFCLFVSAAAAASCAKVEQDSGAGAGSKDAASGSGSTSGSGGTGSGASGGSGGSTAIPGSGGDARGSTNSAGGAGGEVNCGLEKFDLVRKLGDVVVVLDRSASMQKNSMDKTPTGTNDPTKWAQLIPALTSVIAQAGTDISWGLKTFPEHGAECAAATVTTKMDLAVAPMNYTALNAAIMATQPNGNGTPTGAAVAVAADYLKGLQDGNRHYLLLATDGQPSCGGRAGALVKSTTQAQTDAVAAVTAAATAGIHTFVVGVATKDSDQETLNMLAAAGLQARSDPNPLATKYYLGTTQAELVSALQAITGVVNKDCLFPLKKVPPVPDNIAVKVTGVKVPFDTSNTTGWNYADEKTVQVFGSWCEMIKTAAADTVQIIFGCPNIEIP